MTLISDIMSEEEDVGGNDKHVINDRRVDDDDEDEEEVNDDDDEEEEEEEEEEGDKDCKSKSIRDAEGEKVADIGVAIREQYIKARDATTSTGATYAPYQKDFMKFCEEKGWSSAVTDLKLLNYLQDKKAKKTRKKKGRSMKGGCHVEQPGVEKVEFALKTMKGTVCAIIDLWCQQEGKVVEFNGQYFRRGKNHPRSASVKAFLKSHRVLLIFHVVYDLFFA